MAELKALAAQDAEFPRILFVHHNSAAEGEKAMDAIWPDASAIADPNRELYREFDLLEGSLGQLFSLSTLWQTVRALVRGHGIGRPGEGQVRQMGGVFLIEDHRITWQHLYEKGIGAKPSWQSIPRFSNPQDKETPKS